MQEQFAQIEGAAAFSVPNVNVHITEGGSIVGQGIAASPDAIRVCGGNLDNILRSFGGVGGGSLSPDSGVGDKALYAMDQLARGGGAILSELNDLLSANRARRQALERLIDAGGSELGHDVHDELVEIKKGLVVGSARDAAEGIQLCLDQNKRFVKAIEALNASRSESSQAGQLSLLFTNLNEFSQAQKVTAAIKNGGDRKRIQAIGAKIHLSDSGIRKHWHKVLETYHLPIGAAGGAPISAKVSSLAERLTKARKELVSTVNKFIVEFGGNMNALVKAADQLGLEFGKTVALDENADVYLSTFERLSEFTNKKTTLYKHLLVLNPDQVDSVDIQRRFLASVRDLGARASALSTTSAGQHLDKVCHDIIDTVTRYADMIKATHSAVRSSSGGEGASGGTRGDAKIMDELYGLSTTQSIDISGMNNSLEDLAISIRKTKSYRNVAAFRGNLKQTMHELASYTKDYNKSVGGAIGEAISKIKREYKEMIAQIDDDEAGLGLEIGMYNSSTTRNQKKISKEKLKEMFQWQCDARVGLYKTVEAVDLYLLHFTETISGNPDAVGDLHKMLTATRIIAKWYDKKAGENIIKMFESIAKTDSELDANDFMATYEANTMADIKQKVGGDEAVRVFQRCRRAIEGVVVLKNIISYFTTLGEKYGDIKSEKNIFMTASSIYKNLVTYICVSALAMGGSGTEVLTDDNKLKRLVRYDDTKVSFKQAPDFDPLMLGLNMGPHSMEKLRILKLQNELSHLKNSIGSLNDPAWDQSEVSDDWKQIQQFVLGCFTRLRNTKYLVFMAHIGVYDLTYMTTTEDVVEFLKSVRQLLNVDIQVTINAVNPVTIDTLNDDQLNNLGDDIINVLPEERSTHVVISKVAAGAANYQALTSLTNFLSLPRLQVVLDAPAAAAVAAAVAAAAVDPNDAAAVDAVVAAAAVDPNDAAAVAAAVTAADAAAVLAAQNQPGDRGYIISALQGFVEGLVGVAPDPKRVNYAQHVLQALQYCIACMLNEYKRLHVANASAVDDMFFILTIKAIAGKIITSTSINRLMRDPSQQSVLSANSMSTRLIMGGARVEGEVIEEAVELYVRLPLLAEFYRIVFDNANQDIRTNTNTQQPENEMIVYVPEVGNIWTGFLTDIFDRARHIGAGMYTLDNMRNIVGEINGIYRHYKGTVPEAQTTRHIMMELVAEINRRYGVMKREELMYYYRAMTEARKQSLGVNESNYTSNDLDILDDSMGTDAIAPSEEFIKIKAAINDPSNSIETRINKLTDYRIVSEFRDKVHGALNPQNVNLDDQGFKSRIRLLKQAVRTQTSKAEKYNMIIKAIESSETIDQASNDIFVCFHELVLVPLRTLGRMYDSLSFFLLSVFQVIESECVARGDDFNNIVAAIREPMVAALRPYGATQGIQVVVPRGGNGQDGYHQILLMDRLVQFATNAGDLVKLNVSTAKRITIDFSEFQSVCEHLIADVKAMVDKFTGLVPSSLIDLVSASNRMNSIYYLEKNLINDMFNKLEKPFTSQDNIVSLETLDQLMPTISDIIFRNNWTAPPLFLDFAMTHYGFPTGTFIDDRDRCRTLQSANMTTAMPMIRDSFMVYSHQQKTFVRNEQPYHFSPLLFNPNEQSTALPESQLNKGIVQQYNILISRYLNDLYDPQSRKMYTKGFATFSTSSLVDAINGQSFPDFAVFANPQYEFIRAAGAAVGYFQDVLGTMENAASDNEVAQEVLRNHYAVPRRQTILSATLAYVMKTMSSRTHPVSGAKVHETATLQTVSSHAMEKYRACIPMHLRIFSAFLRRCRLYKQIISGITTDNAMAVSTVITNRFGIGSLTGEAVVTELETDQPTVFAREITDNDDAIDATDGHVAIVGSYLDEIITGVTAIIEDIKNFQTELQETDPAVSVFFDVRKDFTKTFLSNEKQLPFSPLSILSIGYATPTTINNVHPMYIAGQFATNKFAYGMRSLLLNNFELSTKNVPYFKKIVEDFNGISNKNNDLDVTTFDGMLTHVGRAANYLFDLRFYNGLTSFTHKDVLVYARNNLVDPNNRGLVNIPPIQTFQERVSLIDSLALVENTNLADSRAKIAERVRDPNAGNVAATAATLRAAVDALAAAARAMVDAGAFAVNANAANANAAVDAITILARRTADVPAAAATAATAIAIAAAATASATIVAIAREISAAIATGADLGAIAPRLTAAANEANAAAAAARDAAAADNANATNAAAPGPGAAPRPQNPRRQVIILNIMEMNIMPINVHALMRDIPLVNIYNYAMTFDQYVDKDRSNQRTSVDNWKQFLKNPYSTQLGLDLVELINSSTDLRFVDSMLAKYLLKRIVRNNANVPFGEPDQFRDNLAVPNRRYTDRFNTKVLRDLVFLVGVQSVIKDNVKTELEFINTRVVTNTNAVSNAITDVMKRETAGDDSTPDTTEELFEF